MSSSEKKDRSGLSRGLRVGVIAGAAFIALFVGGAMLLPLGQASAGLFRHHHGASPEEIRDHATLAAEWVLRSVDATEAQQAEVHAIIERTVNELLPLRESNEEMHAQALAVLTAPTVDRQALEQLRAEKFAQWSGASQQIVTALADIADALTPEQRQELAQLAERWHR